MGLVGDKLISLWQKTQDELLSSIGKDFYIHFHSVATDTVTDYDSFFQESTDPSSPNDYDKDTPEPTLLSGILHTDLYGMSINGNEAIDYSGVGKVQPGDALLTVKYVDAVDGETGKTLFDLAKHITISGYPDMYEVVHIGERGLGERYVVDVFLRKWGAK